jgi:hypothetical protein
VGLILEFYLLIIEKLKAIMRRLPSLVKFILKKRLLQNGDCKKFIFGKTLSISNKLELFLIGRPQNLPKRETKLY